jgi:hypothetical protein
LRFYDFSYRIEIDAKKLLAEIHFIHPQFIEFLMEQIFECWSIVARNHHVNIEGKWHRGTAQLGNAFLGVESARHSDFENILAKRSDIRKNIDMPGFSQLSLRYSTFIFFRFFNSTFALFQAAKRPA